MKSLGFTDSGDRIISLTEDEFMVLGRLADAVENKGRHSRIVKGGVVQPWSGEEVILTRTLDIIRTFADNLDHINDVIRDLRKFRDKWVRDLEVKEPVEPNS